jgi:hypothetical protein
MFLGLINNSCYVFKDPYKRYSGISSNDIKLLVYPSDTITNKFVTLKCKLINDKETDIAFLPFYHEVTTVIDYKAYIWYANIIFKEKNKKKVLLTNFFGDLNLPKASDYLIIKPQNNVEISLGIDFSQLDDDESSKEMKSNTDYGEYEIILWYDDNYKTNPNSINGKVISNSIKVIYQKDYK